MSSMTYDASETANWYSWLAQLGIIPGESHYIIRLITGFFVSLPVASEIPALVTNGAPVHSRPHADHDNRRAADMRPAPLVLPSDRGQPAKSLYAVRQRDWASSTANTTIAGKQDSLDGGG